MMMDTRLPLLGQAPQPIDAFVRGVSGAEMVNAAREQQAQRNFFQQHGADVMAGDPQALAALAQFNPEGAMQIQAHHAAQQRAAAASARAAANAQRAADQERLKSGLAAAYRAETPEEWDRLATEFGVEEYVGRFEDKEAILANIHGITSAIEIEESLTGGDFNSDRYKVVGNALYDLAAEGGPRMIGEGSSDEPVFSYTMADGTVIRFGPEGQMGAAGQAGKVPSGYERFEEVGEDGVVTYVDRPIRGSKPWNDLVDQAQKVQRAFDSFSEKNAVVVEDIDRALELVEGHILPARGTTTVITGMFGESPKARVDALLIGIEANVAFEELTEMRQNSPTGGAVGQLSDSEREAFASVLGALKAATTDEDLSYNLRRLREIRLRAEERLKAAYEEDFAQVGMTLMEPAAVTEVEEGEAIPPTTLHPTAPDLSAMSDEELMAYIAELETTESPAQPPPPQADQAPAVSQQQMPFAPPAAPQQTFPMMQGMGPQAQQMVMQPQTPTTYRPIQQTPGWQASPVVGGDPSMPTSYSVREPQVRGDVIPAQAVEQMPFDQLRSLTPQDIDRMDNEALLAYIDRMERGQ